MVLTKEIEMGYSFTLPKGIAFRVKKEGIYPWPWDGDKDRTIRLFTDDVLTKQENGKYMKHTGLGCLNIVLATEEVEPITEDKHLQML